MAYHHWLQSPLLLSFFLFPFCYSLDFITPSQSIKDGENITSANENFILGFFSPGNSKNRYVGIWYNKVPEQTVVWVANRENPVKNSHGTLKIINGNLIVADGANNTLWSTNISTVLNDSSAKLMDSGNLVLIYGLEDRVLWESFAHPTDTHLPGMKLGLDRRTGLSRFLTSWKSADDPASGEFSFQLDPRGMPQYFLMKSSDPIWRSGPWNGQRLSGVPAMNQTFIFEFHYISNEDEIYFAYNIHNSSIFSRMVLNYSGELLRSTWFDKSHRWTSFWKVPEDGCDPYAECGAYGSCDANSVPECECLRGFEPKTPQDWQLREWVDGCVRSNPLDCAIGDGFFRTAHVKLPDTSRSQLEASLGLEACKDKCLKNCSCTAYASANISGEGSGCLMWVGDLIDLKVYSDGGQDIHIRVPASELDENSKRKTGGVAGKKKYAIIITAVVVVVLALIPCTYCWCKKAKDHTKERHHEIPFSENCFEGSREGPELPFFDLGIVAAATDNFSETNNLGEGGFGPVYKGKLQNGQEIAVKRLSKNSGQGTEEFKTEIMLIAKLQHRNLVRILGYCIHEEEKLLIYEYMPNKSLDSIIFDETKRMLLDWRKRFNIIVGIARGILYLHEDSRLRVVHRDLKLSNILLDDGMNPKIADFGLARIFGGNQTQGNTNRVVGTYGYMSPEYAMDGLFSVKSDVFSFGVILLEIITGKKNNYYCSDDPSMNLIRHVWELWKDGRVLGMVDPTMSDSCYEGEVLRCIQVGILCVQESSEDRPNMSSVVFMLSNETKMSAPKQPAFCLRTSSNHPDSSTSRSSYYSNNDVTITEVDAR